MKKRIVSFKKEPYFENCKRSFLANGTKENEEFNRNLYLINECGDWEIANEKVKEGDALFWRLPDASDINSKYRELHVGIVKQVKPSPTYPGRFRINVQRFEYLGLIKNGIYNFLGVKSLPANALLPIWGSGKSQLARHGAPAEKSVSPSAQLTQLEGEMIQRLTWVRKNHAKFRDPVWAHWEGKCAVTRAECNGLLVASHIKPWSRSSPEEKTDFHNGLMLSASLDSLFDRGFISFSDEGALLIHHRLESKTANIFGLKKTMKLDMSYLTTQMKTNLAWHRKHFKF